MKTRRRFRVLILVILLIVVLLQFVPVNRSIPPIDPSQDFIHVMQPPSGVAASLRDACYDCHSYETRYPWYAYIAPVSLWLQDHVDEGREHLNFSVWTTYSDEDRFDALKETAEMIETQSMPLNSYTWLHPEARLPDSRLQEMLDWIHGVLSR